MKYEVKVTIHKPLEEVLSVMEDSQKAFEWMEGIKDFKLIEGELGQVNSKYKLSFEKNGKKRLMTETIVEKELPNKIVTVYESGGVWNECINLFRGHADHTHLKMISTFKFPWYMSFFIWMFKGMFKRESEKGLQDFKKYIENQ